MYMVYPAANSNILWWATFNGTSWSNNQPIPNIGSPQSTTSPVLATLGNKMYLVYFAANSKLLWWATFS